MPSDRNGSRKEIIMTIAVRRHVPVILGDGALRDTE
jgi:hypothetical protein